MKETEKYELSLSLCPKRSLYFATFRALKTIKYELSTSFYEKRQTSNWLPTVKYSPRHFQLWYDYKMVTKKLPKLLFVQVIKENRTKLQRVIHKSKQSEGFNYGLSQ